MTAKEYLSQARILDESINTKIEILDSLNALACKCTSTISDMPKASGTSGSSLEDTVLKIISLQNEINKEIDSLVERKKEIRAVILMVENSAEQLLLEKRYLCCMPWNEICNALFISKPTSMRLHNSALLSVEKILKKQMLIPNDT